MGYLVIIELNSFAILSNLE